MIALHVPEALVVGTLLFLHVAAYASAVTRAARGRTGAPHDLRYPAAWRAAGVLAGVILVLAALLIDGRGNAWEPEARVAVALLGAGGALEVLLTCVRVFPDGVERRSAWRRPRFFAWGDIASVDLRLDLGWLALRTRRGSQMRVGKRLEGLRTFAALALIHLPREALAGDPVARSWLEERARGIGG